MGLKILKCQIKSFCSLKAYEKREMAIFLLCNLLSFWTDLVVADGLFSFTGSIGPPSCDAEVTQWVLTKEQVGKVRSSSLNCNVHIHGGC